MLSADELEELVFELMNPTLDSLMGCGVEEVFSIEAMIDCVNFIKTEPVRSSAIILRQLAMSKRAYGRLKGLYDEIKLQLDYRENHLKYQAQLRKEDNPYVDLVAKFPPQVSFVNALAKSEEGVQQLSMKAAEVKKKMAAVYEVYEICEKIHETYLTLLQNSDKIPLSGKIIGIDEIQAYSDEFNNNLNKAGLNNQ